MTRFGAELEMVRALMVREDPHGPVHRRPILVVEGGAATGKTELCRRTVLGYAEVPCAYVDLAEVESKLGSIEVPTMLALIAFQLSRRTARYGVIKFERLAVGLLAAGLDLSQDDRPTAGRRITEILKDRRQYDRFKHIVADLARDAVALVPGWTPTNAIDTTVGWGMDLLARSRVLRRRILGPAQAWYGHQDRELGLDSIDGLIALNPTPQAFFPAVNTATPAHLLCGAFLADLRAHFGHRRARFWSLHCLLLLDNVDSPRSRAFLELLAQVQEGPRARDVDRWDPLGIIATGHGGVLGGLPQQERATVRPVRTGPEVKAAVRSPDAVPWLRRVLPPLSVEDTEDLLGHPAMAGDPPWRRAAVLHHLAGGNPGGTALLVSGMVDEGEPHLDPRRLLAFRRNRRTVEDVLADRLVGAVPPHLLSAAVTCAMARNRHEANQVFGWIRTRDPLGVRDLPDDLWDPTGAVPITLVRLLLLRRLAARRTRDERCWSAVCDELAVRCAGDPAATLHYRLAAGRVGEVAAALTARLALGDMPGWLRLLDEVTSAPRHPSAPVAHEAPASDVLPGVRALLARLWTVRDPLCGAERSALHWDIRSAYLDLSHERNDSCDELIDRVFEHERLAQRWSGTAGPHVPAQYAPQLQRELL